MSHFLLQVKKLNFLLFFDSTFYEAASDSPVTPQMKVTAQTIDKVLRAMEAKGRMSQVALAEQVGVHRSYINKLLRGLLPSIPNELADKISDKLGIELIPVHFKDGPVSGTALKLTALAEADPAFSALLETLVAMREGDARRAVIPSVETKYLAKIGAEITRIVHQWEQPQGDYTPKIGSEVLSFLREFYRKGKF